MLTKDPIQKFTNSEFWSKYKTINYSDFIVISEYEESNMFKYKNINNKFEMNIRIIKGLSKAAVFLEDSAWTKDEPILNAIINENKAYFAIPQIVKNDYSSSNELLKNGAKLLEKAADILNQI